MEIAKCPGCSHEQATSDPAFWQCSGCHRRVRNGTIMPSGRPPKERDEYEELCDQFSRVCRFISDLMKRTLRSAGIPYTGDRFEMPELRQKFLRILATADFTRERIEYYRLSAALIVLEREEQRLIGEYGVLEWDDVSQDIREEVLRRSKIETDYVFKGLEGRRFAARRQKQLEGAANEAAIKERRAQRAK